MPKVQGFRYRKHGTNTPSLWALFLEAYTTSYMRDHTDSTGGGVAGYNSTPLSTCTGIFKKRNVIDIGVFIVSSYSRGQCVQKRGT